jgi:hypothetical protein
VSDDRLFTRNPVIAQPAMAQLLPDDLLRLVGHRAAQDAMHEFVRSRREALQPVAATLCRALLALRAASPLLLTGDAETWHTALMHVHARGDKLARETYGAVTEVAVGRLPARRALSLVCLTGCELCRHARVRKANWTFGVRCCQMCIETNTISDYRLRACGLTDEAVLDALPHTHVNMYAPRVGSYSLRFYWRSVALEAVRVGVPDATSLEDAVVKVAERAAAEARAKVDTATAYAEAQHQALRRVLAAGADDPGGAASGGGVLSAKVTCESLRRRSPRFAHLCNARDAGVITAADAAKVGAEVRAHALRTSVTRWLRDLTLGVHPDSGRKTHRIDDAVRRVQERLLPDAGMPTKAWFVREVWSEMRAAVMAEDAEAARIKAARAQEAAASAARRAAEERHRAAWAVLRHRRPAPSTSRWPASMWPTGSPSCTGACCARRPASAASTTTASPPTSATGTVGARLNAVTSDP